MKRTGLVALSVSFLLAAGISAEAQNVSDLIINEVLVENPDGLVDGYGNRSGWIEILNASYGTVDFGGCYLSDDRDNLKKYLIPKGDLQTKLPPRQLALFYTGGEAEKGTFYTNFILSNGSTVYLTSNDGRTVIDSLEIPEDLAAGKSVIRLATDNKGIEFETFISDPTPLTQNGDVNAATKSQIMAEKDPHGWTITFTSICVVFVALIILSIIYTYVGKTFTRTKGKKNMKKENMSPEVALAIAMALDKDNGGEVNAAIAMALHSYLNDTVHDAESFVITIRPSASAWASKQFTLRQLPTRK